MAATLAPTHPANGSLTTLFLIALVRLFNLLTSYRVSDVTFSFTAVRRGDSMRLPGELFYFSGDCTSDVTQQQIKEQFIQSLNASDYQ